MFLPRNYCWVPFKERHVQSTDGLRADQVRYVVMVALYGGFTAVIYSVCVIKNPNGPTPAVSPAMQCANCWCFAL